jgi:propanol-preferring alcohol dehydrogenase
MKAPATMRAMLLEEPGTALRRAEVPVPHPAPNQVLLKVHACGVCRTDLHIVDGELSRPKLPLIPGHEIVGTVVECGPGEARFRPGDRIGVPWLGYTDGTCRYCLRGQENLCDRPQFTGYSIDGGYAEFAVADQRYCFALPEAHSDPELAPLLCAGLIGFRSYQLAGPAARLGLYGFGAAAHILVQIAAYEGRRVFAFTRPGDRKGQEFALRLGAVWAGASTDAPPEELDAAIVFAPVGALMLLALKATCKGGVVVSGGIHMSDIPAFPYDLLWGERVMRSVANLTREDGEQMLALAAKVPIKTQVELFPLDQANEALRRLRQGQIEGAAVLVMP